MTNRRTNSTKHLRPRGPRVAWHRTLLRASALALPAVLTFSVAGLAAPGGNSAASIAGSFADTCRDFASHSSKDISHVETHYADGRVVKDETITSPDYSVDGGNGDEIEFAVVKSGVTTETFNCTRPSSPPTAILELKTRDDCVYFGTYLYCFPEPPFTIWTRTPEAAVQFPVVHSDPLTFSFRGTSSADPDDDITSWSIDFGAGTTATGSWVTEPPTEVAHAFSCHVYCGATTVTLTVTDSAGQTDSDTMDLIWIDGRPD